MKKILLLMLLFPFFISSFALTDKKKKDEKPLSKFSLGVNFSPDVSYRIYYNDKTDKNAYWVRAAFDSMEIPKFGYTVGINASYYFNEHIAFETGIQYSNKGYKTKKYTGFQFAQQNDTTFDPYLTNLSSIQYTYNYHYIDIPFKVNFTYGKGRVKFIGSSGIVLNLLLKVTTTVDIIYSDRKKIVTQNLKPGFATFQKVNVSPILSVGIACMITKHLSLRVEPTFRFGVIRLSNTPLSDYLYNAGLNTSLYWRF